LVDLAARPALVKNGDALSNAFARVHCCEGFELGGGGGIISMHIIIWRERFGGGAKARLVPSRCVRGETQPKALRCAL
jgi:hypothetical protein